MSAMGKKSWIIPDCELPHAGEGVLKGHESVTQGIREYNR